MCNVSHRFIYLIGCILTAVQMAAFRRYNDDAPGAIRIIRELYNTYAVESEQQKDALVLFGQSLSTK